MDQIRQQYKNKILSASVDDERIIGVLDYGSGSEGREDEWSDLDITLVIRDPDFEIFQANWEEWAHQFGPLLAAFIGGIGKPWVVYDTYPIPLRVDFSFLRASSIEEVLTWPNSPTSVEAMVLYDETNGKLGAIVAQIVGQSLAPADLQSKFYQVACDFWYYLLRTFGRLKRGEYWAARHDFNFIIVGNLFGLLKIEANEIDRWRGSSSTLMVESVISLNRLSEMDKLIPTTEVNSLHQSMHDASLIAADVCESISSREYWGWPRDLANRVMSLITVDNNASEK